MSLGAKTTLFEDDYRTVRYAPGYLRSAYIYANKDAASEADESFRVGDHRLYGAVGFGAYYPGCAPGVGERLARKQGTILLPKTTGGVDIDARDYYQHTILTYAAAYNAEMCACSENHARTEAGGGGMLAAKSAKNAKGKKGEGRSVPILFSFCVFCAFCGCSLPLRLGGLCARLNQRPMSHALDTQINATLAEIAGRGLFKHERIIASPQNNRIATSDGQDVLNFCANNYLGLADHPEIIAAARRALDEWGFGMASVRFICGTQEIHKELERALSTFLGTEDTILYPLVLRRQRRSVRDAPVRRGRRHQRRTQPRQHHRRHPPVQSQAVPLQEQRHGRPGSAASGGGRGGRAAQAGRHRRGVLDGRHGRQFEGRLRPRGKNYGALVMFDDCHAAGFLGATGRGTHEHCGVMNRVDIITGTLGKALGGASGGYTSARKPIVDLLRQRSRPYLFSNTVAPCVVAASLKAIEMITASTELPTAWRKTRGISAPGWRRRD